MKLSQHKDIDISGVRSKFVGNDDNSVNNLLLASNTDKLSNLFEKLRNEFENEEEGIAISEDLQRYITRRDSVGLEEKLNIADKSHLYEDFAWLKQEFYKKLVKYQYYEPAQYIFAHLLAIVLEKYRNLVRPKIREGCSESEILEIISIQIIAPIIKSIESEGCDDIIGITSTEIEGMYHYLTGNCHINWKK